MRDKTATATSLVGALIEEAKEHKETLLFGLNCLVWFAAGTLFGVGFL